MKKLLMFSRNVVISIILTCCFMYGLLFVVTVVFSNAGESYPQQAHLSGIAVGNSDTLTADDMVLRYWRKGDVLPKITMTLSQLSADILNANYVKCNSFERTLVCFVQNQNNTIITFSQNSPEKMTLTTGTRSIDFVNAFGTSYIIVSCNTDSGHPMKTNDTIVVYKTKTDIYNSVKEYESLSNYKGDYMVTSGMYLYSGSDNWFLIDMLWLFVSLLVFLLSYRLFLKKQIPVRQGIE